MYGTVLKKIKAPQTMQRLSIVVDLPALYFSWLATKLIKKSTAWNNAGSIGLVFLSLSFLLSFVALGIILTTSGHAWQYIKICQGGLIGRYKTSAVAATKMNCSYSEIADVICENNDIILHTKSGASFRFVNMKDAYNGAAYIKRMIEKQQGNNNPNANRDGAFVNAMLNN